MTELNLILCCEKKSPVSLQRGDYGSGAHSGDVRGCVTC